MKEGGEGVSGGVGMLKANGAADPLAAEGRRVATRLDFTDSSLSAATRGSKRNQRAGVPFRSTAHRKQGTSPRTSLRLDPRLAESHPPRCARGKMTGPLTSGPRSDL